MPLMIPISWLPDVAVMQSVICKMMENSSVSKAPDLNNHSLRITKELY